MCQQSLEKIIKAIFVKRNRKTPPYTHNLSRFLKDAGLYAELGNEQLKVLEVINSFYIAKIHEALSKSKVAEFIVQTEELLRWFKARL